MTDILLGEQDLFNFGYRDITSNDNGASLDHLTAPFQITPAPDFTYSSWMSRDNALGFEPGSVQVADLFAYPYATSTSNQIDGPLFKTSISHQLYPSESMMRLEQMPTNRYPSVCKVATLFEVGKNPIAHPCHSLTPLESISAQGPTAHSPDKFRASRSLSQSTPPCPQRYTPYPIGPGSTRRSTLPTSVYQCQWLEGARSCGVTVTGTKNEIQKHLHDVHGISTRADKTDEVCRWDKCRKSMRRESIARHILAVHMGDKVPCPNCGLRFARTDSLQRHQRTQCLVNRAVLDPGKAAVRFDLAHDG